MSKTRSKCSATRSFSRSVGSLEALLCWERYGGDLANVVYAAWVTGVRADFRTAMTDDKLAAKVTQLLSEPRPRAAQRPKAREFSASPLDRAQAVLCLANDLVAEADYVAAAADWEQ